MITFTTIKLDPKNHQSWQTIHRAISVISLERNLPDISVEPDHPDFFEEMYSLFTAASLHGYGVKYSIANRWNDKAITHYIGRYGNHGMLGEHSGIDGSSIFPYNIHIEKAV